MRFKSKGVPYEKRLLHALSPVHRKAARMVFDGKNSTAVAAECGVTLTSVMRWRSSPLFKEYVAQLETRAQDAIVSPHGGANALDIIKSKAELAAERLTDMLADENWHKLRASDKLGVIERCFRAMGIDKPDGAGTAIQIVIQQSDLDRAARVKGELEAGDILEG